MPVCCICGKKTLNVFIKDRKAFCMSCVKAAGMYTGSIMSKQLLKASEEDVRQAINNRRALNAQETKLVSEFKGNPGKIELYDDKIVIKRGALQPHSRSQKEIYLSSITAIQIGKPGVRSGYIQFLVSGSQEVKKRSIFGVEIACDENSVLFDGKQKYEEALVFKSQIEKLKNKPIQPSVIVQNQISVADELLKLKTLLDAGVLTEEEFTQQKNKLLNN